MGMHNFRELKIWQRSMNLAERVYKIIADFPKEERYGLTAQIKSCTVSIPSNISEGAGRATQKQFKYFLEISMGSCNELQTQLELSKRFNYLTQELADEIIDEVFQVYKMTLAFYHSLGSD
jgi:four helix bundle protein